MAASPPSSDERYPIGSVLDGRYRIDAVLGTGGMGKVYRAEHTKIGKTVAIKVLHADLYRNREASQRFQREAIASGRLDHPNIVAVSDFGVLDDGACYLVMEVLEGESLGDRLIRDKHIHWVEAIEILRGVLHGLRHAHERGVVHRDIKPDNVFLARKDGETIIKILDFGIAKLYAGASDDPASTRAGLTVGTPAYLSPEQAVGGEITPKSDLYSASIVLYEMLAGRAPFEDKDPLAMLGAHVSRRPPRFSVIAPGVEVPPRLEAIVQHGLAKTAADRIASAGDYLALLDAFSPPLAPRATLSELSVSAARTERSPAVKASLVGALPRTAAPSGPPSWSGPAVAAAAASHPSWSGVALPGVAPSGDPPWSGASSSAVEAAAAPASTAATASSEARPPAAATPARGAPTATAAATSLEGPLPRALQAVALADLGEPIPLTWIVRSGVVIGFVIIAAVVLAIAAHCHGSEPEAKAPAKPTAAASRPVDRDAQLKAWQQTLESGKTCADRRAAIAKLLELRDVRALPAIRAARNRTTDDNACLKADADRAIKELSAIK